MKYNNKLNLVEYLQTVNEIVAEYFDSEKYEYSPHVGEMYVVCAYFNHCVELEEDDVIKQHPIDDILDMQQLYDNEDFMEHFNNEIDSYDAVNFNLTFGHAYQNAMDIVESKKSDANAFATAISASMNAILQAFRNSFSDSDIQKFTDIAQQVLNGKISNEAIVNAYEHSERFKENTEEVNKAKIVSFPQNEE